MRIKRRSTLAMALLLVALNSISAFAAQESDKEIVAVPIEVPTDETEASTRSVQGPMGGRPARPEDIALAVEDVEETDDSSDMSAKATWYYLDNTFYVYNQSTYYYCGPAAVQAVLRYINGSASSQATIANGCNTSSENGTYLSDMITYLNKKQSTNTYKASYSSSSSILKSKIYTDIVTNDIPLIIGLAFSSGDGWLYDTTGHFMSVYGVASDKSSFALADPWIGYSGSGLSSYSSSYTKTASTVYSAYNSGGLGIAY